MSDIAATKPNPYRFTVSVESEPFSDDLQVWYVAVRWNDALWWAGDDCDTEAEANEHAELIRQAMREVS